MKKKNVFIQAGFIAFLVLVGALAVYFLIFNLGNIVQFIKNVIKIMAPVNIGIALAYLLNPIVDFLNGLLLKWFAHTKLQLKTRKKIAKGLSVGLALATLVAVVVGLLYTVIPEVIDSIQKLIPNIPAYGDSLRSYISELFKGSEEMEETVQNAINTAFGSIEKWLKNDLLGEFQKIIGTLTTGIYGAFKILVNIVLGLCVTVYLLLSKQRFIGGFKKLLYATFKKETVNVFLAVGREADSIFGGFISGKLLDSLIIGILCFIGCSIMKMPYIALISVVIGVTNIVPIFGPWVGAIPCSLLVLIIDPGKALVFVIFVVALQQFDGNILGPNILGDSTGLSAFWVVVAITLGGGLFKLPGMILGVPTFAVIYFVVKTYVEFKLKEQNMPIQTISYTKIKRIDPETFNSEYINTSMSKRDKRKNNVYVDDVSREVAIAARLARSEREKRDGVFGPVVVDNEEGNSEE
ncbi:MAG: AI-2E family transporter [Lachnospiraceae bacterium]|nr:AI-2E family transporter [Lachnospiraceae bacterium]